MKGSETREEISPLNSSLDLKATKTMGRHVASCAASRLNIAYAESRASRLQGINYQSEGSDASHFVIYAADDPGNLVIRMPAWLHAKKPTVSETTGTHALTAVVRVGLFQDFPDTYVHS